jgi:hypothetical protein
MGKSLLLSESEGSLSYLESNTVNELDDRALLDVVSDGNDEDDNIT